VVKQITLFRLNKMPDRNRKKPLWANVQHSFTAARARQDKTLWGVGLHATTATTHGCHAEAEREVGEEWNFCERWGRLCV
jgi:hypothetical protein